MESLKTLCNLAGVSGDEGEVCAFIRSSLSKIPGAEVTRDKMDNILVFKKGKKRAKQKLLFCAHMDEVGFIIRHITDGGFLKFSPVGGVDEKILPGERVLIGKDKIPGVVGIKAIHIQEEDEAKKAIPMDKLYLDIGASTKEEAEKIVSLGDFASFAPNFKEFGENRILSKALDDRAGCALLLRLLQEELPQDLYAAFTVQEEVGLRGARVAANTLKPDVVVAAETTTAADFPGVPAHQHVTSLGRGPALSLLDGYTFYDRELLSRCEKIAAAAGVKTQYKRSASGGNDIGAFGAANGGARGLCVSIPCRNLHSPLTVIHKSDYEETYKLLLALAEGILKGEPA